MVWSKDSAAQVLRELLGMRCQWYIMYAEICCHNAVLITIFTLYGLSYCIYDRHIVTIRTSN
jgi:hypothetical protein